MSWAKCSRNACRMFSVKQYGRSECLVCERPFRGLPKVDPDPDADIDETLLLRSRERLTKELARIDERLAEIKLLKGAGQ